MNNDGLSHFVFRFIQKNKSLTVEDIYSFFKDIAPSTKLENIIYSLDNLKEARRIKLVATGIDPWLDTYSRV